MHFDALHFDALPFDASDKFVFGSLNRFFVLWHISHQLSGGISQKDF